MSNVVIRVKTTRHYGPKHIASIQKRVQSNSSKAAYNFARSATASAKRRAHVITGNLKRSIHWVRLSEGKFVVRVGAYYGVYEEYGTRHRPPHPYFRPAVVEAKADFMRDMARVFHR